MRTDSDSPWLLGGLCLIAVAAAGVLHAVYIPRYLPGSFSRALPYLVVGWASYAFVFYALGRLGPLASGMPSMRALDFGLGLFLFSIVVSGLFDAAGLTLTVAPGLHLLPALGLYVGLALAGWGFGARTRAVNRIAAETERG